MAVSYDDPGKRGRGATSFDGSGVVGVVEPLPPASRRYEGAVERLRATSDYLHYLDPRFADAPYLRRRLERNLDGTLHRLTGLPYGSRAGRAGLAVTLGLERVVPADVSVSSALADLRAGRGLRLAADRPQQPEPTADRHGQGGPADRRALGLRGRQLGPPDDQGRGQGAPRRDARLERAPAPRCRRAALRARGRASSSRAPSSSTHGSTGSRAPRRKSSPRRSGSKRRVTWCTSAPRRTSRRRSGRSRSSAAGSRRSARPATHPRP